jgi:formylglycine-generating enzyme required for sulfatase activity
LEWEDSCNGVTGTGDACRIRGGSFFGYEPFLACAYDVSDSRDFNYDGLGFRCCGAPI